MSYAEPLPGPGLERPIVHPTGSADVFETLRDEPDAIIFCIYDDGMQAGAVYHTPEGTSNLRGVRFAPLCPEHINKERDRPRTMLLDLSGGYWTLPGQDPPLRLGERLKDYQAVLAGLEGEEVRPSGLLQGMRKFLGK